MRSRFRLFSVVIFFIFLYSSLIFRIYSLQIKNGDYYAARAASQHRLEPRRGSIYFTDQYGNPIPAAITKPYPVIYAVPGKINDPIAAAESLSEILGISKEKLMTVLSKKSDPYELLLRKASDGQIKKIQELNISGIYIDAEDARFYPFGRLAAHLLGFVGPTAENFYPTGRYGLEFYYNDELNGEQGRLEEDRLIEPIPGKDIRLTVDSNIQTRAEEVLRNLAQKYGAEKGIVMVQEPKTGKILAMGAYPDFNPNSYAEYPIKNFLNPAIQALYEPGSVMKVITMSAGLDSGKLTPETAFYDSGSLTLDGRTIKNWDQKAHGKVTMTEIIEQSINTGAAYAQKLIGKDLFYNYLVNFGFGAKTGVEFPGEVAGDLANLKSSSRDINFATASFGQGISVTPVQLLNAVSAIANRGLLMKPYFLESEAPTAVRRVLNEKSAKEITEMMVSAVRKATIAQIPKFDIAGKTGTAQIPDFKRGGYSEEFIHTFVGFAPAHNPKFTIFIRIDKPIGAPLAGLTVVPAFRELAEFILNYYNVPPDHIE